MYLITQQLAHTALYSKSETQGKDKTYFTLFWTYLQFIQDCSHDEAEKKPPSSDSHRQYIENTVKGHA